jgi:hypothetical protein
MLLGFIAGVTILFGLPIGRLRRPATTLRALLNATAIGVLLFLVWDVLTHAWAPIEDALTLATASSSPQVWPPDCCLWSTTSTGWVASLRGHSPLRRRAAMAPGR